MRLNAEVLEEPDLIFGGQGTDKDPRSGLDAHGPFHTSDEPAPTLSTICIGRIGTGENLTRFEQLVSRLRGEIKSASPNHWLYPDFPGVHQETKFQCDLRLADRWTASLTEADLEDLGKVIETGERIAACANLYVEKIESLAMEDDPPDVVVTVLPTWVEEHCGRPKDGKGVKKPEPTSLEKIRSKMPSLAEFGVLEEEESKERDFDLRSAIKGKSMAFGIPIQVLRQSTLDGILKALKKGRSSRTSGGLQPPDQFAWNFCTGLYYKASGRPWRLTRLTPGTCYVGVTFFENKRLPENENLQFSMAQVFTHSLEGFVIRGTEVEYDERLRRAAMKREQARDLLRQAIETYEQKTGPPARVVVHKSSSFSEAELAGMREAIGDKRKDLVALRDTDIRFMRSGRFPPLRGSLISLDASKHLLYTNGYIPRLRTYPGNRVPRPWLLEHTGDSDIKFVAREILGLTKLDWNTADFARDDPITTGFPKKVGGVISELEDDSLIQNHYRFYM